MPFIRPAVIVLMVIVLISALLTLIVIHGLEISKGWGGEGTVIATVCAWISPESSPRAIVLAAALSARLGAQKAVVHAVDHEHGVSPQLLSDWICVEECQNHHPN